MKGELFTNLRGQECRVVHLFKHVTWVKTKDGSIKSLQHKYIHNSRYVEGYSTYNKTPRLTTKNGSNILKELISKYT